MKSEEILEAAKEAGVEPFKKHERDTENTYEFCDSDLQRFVAIIEKRTIERCAAECNDKLIDHISFAEHFAIRLCAAAIRKLGEQ